MIPLAEARAHVLAACAPLPPEPLPLERLAGHVLAEDVLAGHALPSFDNSAMDGYALRSLDTTAAPTRLRVLGTLTAGETTDVTVEAGTALRIMTGAPMPPGADAVCVVEATRTEDDGSTVVVETPVRVDENVRHAGEDLEKGVTIFPAGTVLGPWQVGVLASVGCPSAPVYPRPRVAVIATGDELVPPGVQLTRGKVHDSNRPALLAGLRADGFEAVDLGTVPDDEKALVEAVEEAARCDAVVTSGGVSVGEHDLVKAVLEKLSGGTLRPMQVAIRPARPFAFGLLAASGAPVFCVPGNPVASVVSYEVLVRPALRQMAGFAQLDRPTFVARAGEAMRRRADGKLHLVLVSARVEADGEIVVVAAGPQRSHGMGAMAGANALALLPDGAGVGSGERVTILLLEADRLDARAVPPPW